MSITTSWKSELSFAERMQNTLTIAKVWQTKHDCDFSTARSKAQETETNAFEVSRSREAYEKKCQEITLSLDHSANEPHGLSSPIESGKSTPTILPDVSGRPTYKLGPYENCTHLYSGLFSTIYLTQSPTPPPSHLAIKCTSPAREQPPHNSRREARILSSLSHPHIIPLLATNTATNSLSCPFLLTFPYKPLTLADLLLTSSPSSPIPKSILHNLFSALTYLHEPPHCIIHRDVKPSNILLASPTGPASLADFGIAWSPSDRDSEPPGQKITDVGTTCYRAPELLFGDSAYGVGVDLWAAGCVAAEVFVHDARGRKGGGGSGRDRGEGEGEWTLFKAGELGSELALVKSIFETLGTPDEEVWPECSRFPDWGKMTFKQFPGKGWDEILRRVGGEERELVGRLVRYESGERMRAGEVLEHACFQRG